MSKTEDVRRSDAVSHMRTVLGVIDGWIRYRDGGRVSNHLPDDFSIRMGGAKKSALATAGLTLGEDPDLDHYGFLRVEEAITGLCKLRSQRETINQLLTHIFRDGLPLKSFNGASFGWEHEPILQQTIKALFEEIGARIRATPWVEEICIPKGDHPDQYSQPMKEKESA